MKKDPRKLRVIALLIALGFVGGMFVQYKAPGTFVFPGHKAEKKNKAAVAQGGRDALDEEGSAEAAPRGAASLDSPPPSTAADAEAAEWKKREEEEKQAEKAAEPKPLPPEEVTPEVLRRYAAISAVVDNTLEIAGPNGEKRYVYFAPRGVVAEFGGGRIEARLWTRDDDHLCRGLGADKRECFYFAVRLNDPLRKGSIKTLPDRVDALQVGAVMGAVEGMGAPNVKLLRGNVMKLPGYIPLLEARPGPEWTRDAVEGARSFVGAILLRQRRDEDRAATFFAPNGQVFEVSRVARQTVSVWIGAWRRQGGVVCRELNPEEDGQAGARTEECARVRIADGRVEFAEAGPTRRVFIRLPWADEEPETAGAAASEPSPQTSEVNLAPSNGSRKSPAGKGSFTDLR
jgi:hypothetical protein